MNQQMIAEFKEFLVASMNEDVYYQLKSWLESADIDDDQYPLLTLCVRIFTVRCSGWTVE